jgi:ABC-2 type transport system ATP-binding protein
MSAILSLDKISKHFGSVKALREVSFEVPEGSVFGILGPNGSGKTTLLGIVTDVLRASGGHFLWFGQKPSGDHRKQIGSLLETPNFYHYLSARRNLEITAVIKDKPKGDIDRVLKLLKLYERRDSKFQTYSLGMKQRLAIAGCLLGNPPVLVFDEPTNGLDPSGIAEIRELIIELSQQGKTIILASHLLAEVEKVCTHVAILQQGVLIRSGSVASALNQEEWLEVSATDLQALHSLLSRLDKVEKILPAGEFLRVFPKEGLTTVMLNRLCFENGIILSHLRLKKSSLETAFIELTKPGGN